MIRKRHVYLKLISRFPKRNCIQKFEQNFDLRVLAKFLKFSLNTKQKVENFHHHTWVFQHPFSFDSFSQFNYHNFFPYHSIFISSHSSFLEYQKKNWNKNKTITNVHKKIYNSVFLQPFFIAIDCVCLVFLFPFPLSINFHFWGVDGDKLLWQKIIFWC